LKKIIVILIINAITRQSKAMKYRFVNTGWSKLTLFIVSKTEQHTEDIITAGNPKIIPICKNGILDATAHMIK